MKTNAETVSLSPRELEVCRAVWAESPDKLICAALGIGRGTLRTYLTRALAKTGAKTRVGLALWYERHVMQSAVITKADMRQKPKCAKVSTTKGQK